MTAAAAQMTRLIRTFRKTGTFRDAPTFIVHHILTASIMHLLNATTSESTIRQQAIGRFRICIGALEEMQPRWWQHVQKAVRLLQGLAERWAVVFALPIRLSNPVNPANDKIVQSVRLDVSPEFVDVEEHLVPANDADQGIVQAGADKASSDPWSFALSDEQFTQNTAVNTNALWDFSMYPDLTQVPGFEWMDSV
ncbi:hypothetical protein K505DRAFT_379939 [Melanomma pulvis-pyrius CBS 109.77]|uniref:Uncharacterized protein n=1 Tax=Melanomma pulvis-pyrius CBS 109.77 TaxID=1314802 RepID=A0A6A6WS30_9PLEO|nr:hypothetical protein K505DRAFT_379939 [Melanomma pulvis-pyrius CBS 109.77]